MARHALAPGPVGGVQRNFESKIRQIKFGSESFWVILLQIPHFAVGEKLKENTEKQTIDRSRSKILADSTSKSTQG